MLSYLLPRSKARIFFLFRVWKIMLKLEFDAVEIYNNTESRIWVEVLYRASVHHIDAGYPYRERKGLKMEWRDQELWVSRYTGRQWSANEN